MKTEVIKINKARPEKAKIERAAKLIRAGALVAFPTETVYGLGADALNAKAVKKIFIAKGRPSDNPLIVHIADKSQLELLARDIPPAAELLAKKFWPGPLTMVLKKTRAVPSVVTGGLDTVAIRMPDHPIAAALIRASAPIAAPSANLSGKPSPTTAKHVLKDMDGRIPLIIDGGHAHVGVESTVIDLTTEQPVILRPGRVTAEQLGKILGEVTVSRGSTSAPHSPGMKYRHYSPEAELWLICGGPRADIEMRELARTARESKRSVATIGPYNYGAKYTAICETPEMMAHHLFTKFREFDSKGAEIILVRGTVEKGIGTALMNRLMKAATRVLVF